MKKLAIILSCIAVCGCTITKVEKTKDGWTAINKSLLWNRKNIIAQVETNGTMKFSEDSSTPDEKTLGKVLDIAQALATKAP